MNPPRPHPQAPVQGFTLIEILVAIAIVGLLTAALSSLMINMLRVNQGNQQKLNLTTTVQQAAEGVRGAWLTPANYSSACAQVTLPAGVSAKFINLNARGEPLVAADAGSTVLTSNCAAQPVNGSGTPVTAPPLRRLVVRGTDGTQTLEVTLDVPGNS